MKSAVLCFVVLAIASLACARSTSVHSQRAPLSTPSLAIPAVEKSGASSPRDDAREQRAETEAADENASLGGEGGVVSPLVPHDASSDVRSQAEMLYAKGGAPSGWTRALLVALADVCDAHAAERQVVGDGLRAQRAAAPATSCKHFHGDETHPTGELAIVPTTGVVFERRAHVVQHAWICPKGVTPPSDVATHEESALHEQQHICDQANAERSSPTQTIAAPKRNWTGSP